MLGSVVDSMVGSVGGHVEGMWMEHTALGKDLAQSQSYHVPSKLSINMQSQASPPFG